MMAKVLLSHRRGTRREGLGVLAAAILTSGGLLAGIHVFVWINPEFLANDPWFYYVFCGVALVIGAMLILCVAVPNLRMHEEFRFVVSEKRMECVSPAEAFGESYSILLDEIAMLEEEDSASEGANEWCVVTQKGRRIHITPNYGNPVREIVETLRELKPEIPVRHVY
ncbi:MAG: hypothetical protein JXB62_05705 [Pirellulales bacterium]|nr:hypothetical protein [Pirellulales bacterium]